MKHTGKLFVIGLKQIAKDGMLLALVPAPFLMGAFFKMVLPWADGLLTRELAFSIQPWYGLADGMLLCLTPMFVAMIAAFLLLEERDEGLGAFYQITPAAGVSYLLARIGLPMAWAFAGAVAVTALFGLSALPPAVLLAGALLSTLTGAALAMMVVSLAGNRVEGLALSKLMGVSFLGLFLVWFLPAPYHFALAFLPSFWIGKLLLDGAAPLSVLLGGVTCLFWIALFTGRFLKRV